MSIEEELKKLEQPPRHLTFEGMVDQFLWNYVDDSEQDEAREELAGLFEIVKKYNGVSQTKTTDEK